MGKISYGGIANEARRLESITTLPVCREGCSNVSMAFSVAMPRTSRMYCQPRLRSEREEREEDGEDKLWGYRQRSSPAREYNAGTIMVCREGCSNVSMAFSVAMPRTSRMYCQPRLRRLNMKL
jgi:hypothetical protein